MSNIDIASIVSAITADGGRVEIHLDVEATSLRGIAFAFGALVRQGDNVLGELALLSEEGEAQAGAWVRDNVLPHLGDLPRVKTLGEMCATFWELYSQVKAAVITAHDCQPWELAGRFALVGDAMWPVEAGFLAMAHDWAMANAGAGEFDGPYMPVDIASALDALGYNPDLPRSEVAALLGVNGPKHNPIVDARQSAAIYDAARRGDPVLEKYRM